MLKNVWTNAYELNSTPIVDFKALIIATIAFVGSLLYKKLTKKNLSAILVIVFGAVAGIIVY